MTRLKESTPPSNRDPYLSKLGLESGYQVLFQRGEVADPDQLGAREVMEHHQKRIYVIYL